MTTASNSARTCAKLSGSGVEHSLSSWSGFMAERLGQRGGGCQATEPRMVNREPAPPAYAKNTSRPQAHTKTAVNSNMRRPGRSPIYIAGKEAIGRCDKAADPAR